jgi:hypothetical protein
MKDGANFQTTLADVPFLSACLVFELPGLAIDGKINWAEDEEGGEGEALIYQITEEA